MQINNRRLLMNGIDARYKRAYDRKQWWKADKLLTFALNLGKLFLILLALSISSQASSHRDRSTIDPGGSAPHADADPYGEDKPRLKIISHVVIPATATMPSDCTKDSCGKPAIEDKR